MTMNVVGLIPARGGSKGIPRKNVKLLGGRPLIGWTIEAARGAGLSRVVVSTDDEEIAEIARGEGAEVPFLRPADLSGDQAGAMGVIHHALATLDGPGWHTDALAYLQPTSPFRRADAVRSAVTAFEVSDADTLVSVRQVPHNMTPEAQMSISDGRLLFPQSGIGALRRQEKPESFARNGPAILLLSREAAQAERLYQGRVMPFLMNRLESFDIDDPEDWEWAERLFPLAYPG